ncbi:MAG: hypothetical protein Q9218_002558 [Villophora microphyllina]
MNRDDQIAAPSWRLRVMAASEPPNRFDPFEHFCIHILRVAGQSYNFIVDVMLKTEVLMKVDLLKGGQDTSDLKEVTAQEIERAFKQYRRERKDVHEEQAAKRIKFYQSTCEPVKTLVAGRDPQPGDEAHGSEYAEKGFKALFHERSHDVESSKVTGLWMGYLKLHSSYDWGHISRRELETTEGDQQQSQA